MSWMDCVINKASVESIFPTEPLLAGVRMHEVQFHQDGPSVLLRFDLSAFPDSPPKKWVASNFNRVQLVLRFGGIADVSLEGWATDNIGDIELVKDGSGVRMRFLAVSSRLECHATVVDVGKISGYCSTSATI